MPRITNIVDIDAPAHDVYATIRALDGYPTWLTHSLVYRGTRMRVSEVGGRLTYEDSTMIGRMRGELVEDVPDRVLQFHQQKPSGSVDAVIRYELDAAGSGTRVTRVGELTTRGVFRLGQPILVRMAAAESGRTMTALKAHVERKR